MSDIDSVMDLHPSEEQKLNAIDCIKRERVTDELPTESFILEVRDQDLTESCVAEKWKKPKLKQSFMRKVYYIAEKYQLGGTLSAKKQKQQRGKK